MKFGFPISVFMHLTFAFGGFLMWNNNTVIMDDVRIIPLELVTVTDITNIKPAQKLPDPIEPPIEEETPEPEPEPEIPLEEPTESPDGELLADTPPDEPPNVEPEQSAFNLDDFAAMVDQARKENPNANSQTVLQSEIGERTIIGAGSEDGLTASAEEYIQAKMAGCYKIDTGAKDYQKLRVEVRVHFNIDGEVLDIDVLNNMQIIASPNNSWRAARDNVIFALNECAPYDKLPKQDFSTWKSSRLNFQPADEG